MYLLLLFQNDSIFTELKGLLIGFMHSFVNLYRQIKCARTSDITVENFLHSSSHCQTDNITQNDDSFSLTFEHGIN